MRQTTYHARWPQEVGIRRPPRIAWDLEDELQAAQAMLLEDAHLSNWNSKIVGHVADVRTGLAYTFFQKYTIPLWAYRQGPELFLYYVAHELSHLVCQEHGHGKRFYEVFFKLCPAWAYHHESGYKPRNYVRYGKEFGALK